MAQRLTKTQSQIIFYILSLRCGQTKKLLLNLRVMNSLSFIFICTGYKSILLSLNVNLKVSVIVLFGTTTFSMITTILLK